MPDCRGRAFILLTTCQLVAVDKRPKVGLVDVGDTEISQNPSSLSLDGKFER